MTQVLERPPEFTEHRHDVRDPEKETQNTAPLFINRSLVLLRVVVGLLFVGHGSQKLFGWFGGQGMAGWTESIQKAGLEPVMFWAYFEPIAEMTAGAMLVLGLLTPLAAAVIIGDMLVAIIKVHAGKGLWSQNGGFEYNLVLIALLLLVGFVGPGLYSLDRRLPFALPRPHTFIAALVVTALVVGLAMLT
jgi:putative oxidoreductase